LVAAIVQRSPVALASNRKGAFRGFGDFVPPFDPPPAPLVAGRLHAKECTTNTPLVDLAQGGCYIEGESTISG
jgi:hypothetical protein